MRLLVGGLHHRRRRLRAVGPHPASAVGFPAAGGGGPGRRPTAARGAPRSVLRPPHQRVVGERLLPDLVLVGAQPEFAARAERRQGAGAGLHGRAVVDLDVALGVDVHVRDAALEIEEGDGLAGAELQHAFLDQNLAADEDDALTVFGPGGGVVGADDDGRGVAGDVARDVQRLGGRRRRRGTARCGRAAGRPGPGP